MLTPQIMGALALAILWVNVLLVAAAAVKESNDLARRLRGLRPLRAGDEGAGLLEARVEEGGGPGGALARYEVEQIGRAGDATKGLRTIHFADRAFGGAVLGGTVSADNERVHVPAAEGEVWPARADVLAAAACRDQAQFDAAFEGARKARGHVRSVEVAVREGDRVWIAGEAHRSEGGLALRAAPGIGLLVSAIDPRAWLRRSIALALGFAAAEIVVAAGVTAVAMVPPVLDGTISKIGGALGLAFFLGVQPLGTAVRDAVRVPARAFVRGLWIEPRPSPRYSEGKSAQQRVPVE